MKSPLSPLFFESTHSVKWVPPNPTTSERRPGISMALCQWDSAKREAFFNWRRRAYVGAWRGQIEMDFSNLLLVVKGEWSHTEMHEICFCLMEWRRLQEDETEKANHSLSCQYHLRLHTQPETHVCQGGGWWQRYRKYNNIMHRMFLRGLGNPTSSFSSPGPHWCLDFNCRAKKSL